MPVYFLAFVILLQPTLIRPHIEAGTFDLNQCITAAIQLNKIDPNVKKYSQYHGRWVCLKTLNNRTL